MQIILTYDWAKLNINWPYKLATLEPSGDSPVQLFEKDWSKSGSTDNVRFFAQVLFWHFWQHLLNSSKDI